MRRRWPPPRKPSGSSASWPRRTRPHSSRSFSTAFKLCNWLSKLGRNEEALAYADEAVPIVQKLAQTNRAAAEPGLARVLATRGASLWQLGQREEAKADLRGAVNIWQRLVQENPDAFRPHLAAALLPLGGLLSDLCLIHEARAAAKEAIEIYRRLAGEYPAKLSLAGALLILGGALSDVWLIEEARAAADAAPAAAEEAARILREKARVIPDVFEPPLGPALCLLSASLAELGQHEEAKAAAGEAVHITRKLARENRAKYGHDLATALTCQRRPGRTRATLISPWPRRYWYMSPAWKAPSRTSALKPRTQQRQCGCSCRPIAALGSAVATPRG